MREHTSTPLEAYVASVFEAREKANGQTNHEDVAYHLVGETPITGALAKHIRSMETQPFLYNGVFPTLKELLATPNTDIAMWTQGNIRGQLEKLVTGGFATLRRRVGKDRMSILAQEDKITTLPKLFSELATSYDELIFVDDKSKNVLAVKQQAEKWHALHPESSLLITSLWMNQGRTAGKVPDGYDLHSFQQKFPTLHAFEGLAQFAKEKEADNPRKRLYLIDVDHTVLNTAAAKNHLFQRLVHTLQQVPRVISHVQDLQAGIFYPKSIELFNNGMSGRQVLRIQKHDGQTLIAKFNEEGPSSQEAIKTYNEIRGLGILMQTPMKELLPKIHAISPESALLVMEEVHGTSGRELLKQGLLSKDQALRIQTALLDTKLAWWSSQVDQGIPPIDGLRHVSMQREELTDTMHSFSQALQDLAKTYGIPEKKLLSTPIAFSGKEHLSIGEALETLTTFLHAQDQDPHLLCHGDITLANLIINPDDSSFKIIDGEWTGIHDPAEAYVRMAKNVSTTTALPHSIQSTLSLTGNSLVLSSTADFSDAAIALQTNAISRSAEFQTTLKSPHFTYKMFLYFAGSYAREVALAKKRGMGANEQLFAIMKMIEMIEFAYSQKDFL